MESRKERPTTVILSVSATTPCSVLTSLGIVKEHSFLYAIRLPANDILEREIKHLLKRPEGELPEKPVIRYHDFQYQAKSWDHPRRVVAKVEWHRGQLFPRVGFVVTNLSAKPEGVVHFYNRRGTAAAFHPDLQSG